MKAFNLILKKNLDKFSFCLVILFFISLRPEIILWFISGIFIGLTVLSKSTRRVFSFFLAPLMLLILILVFFENLLLRPADSQWPLWIIGPTLPYTPILLAFFIVIFLLVGAIAMRLTGIPAIKSSFLAIIGLLAPFLILVVISSNFKSQLNSNSLASIGVKSIFRVNHIYPSTGTFFYQGKETILVRILPSESKSKFTFIHSIHISDHVQMDMSQMQKNIDRHHSVTASIPSVDFISETGKNWKLSKPNEDVWIYSRKYSAKYDRCLQENSAIPSFIWGASTKSNQLQIAHGCFPLSPFLPSKGSSMQVVAPANFVLTTEPRYSRVNINPENGTEIFEIILSPPGADISAIDFFRFTEPPTTTTIVLLKEEYQSQIMTAILRLIWSEWFLGITFTIGLILSVELYYRYRAIHFNFSILSRTVNSMHHSISSAIAKSYFIIKCHMHIALILLASISISLMLIFFLQKKTNYLLPQGPLKETERSIDNQSIEMRIKIIVAKSAGLDPSEIDIEGNFIEDYWLDDLDIAEILATIEVEFNIKFPDNYSTNLSTVEQLVKYIEKYKNYKIPEN
jgi:acyl carrier protein